MHRKIGIAAVALVGLATSAQANTTRFFTGMDCLGHTAVDSWIGRFTEACFNFAQMSAFDASTGLCGPDVIASFPIIANTSDTVDYESITVNYTSSNTVERISCQALAMNSSGSVFSSPSQDSLLASNLTTPATGSITWTGATLPNAGTAITAVRSQAIFCSIPSRYVLVGGVCTPASTFTGIVNYAVETVQP